MGGDTDGGWFETFVFLIILLTYGTIGYIISSNRSDNAISISKELKIKENGDIK